jgi:hypothetical protein
MRAETQQPKQIDWAESLRKYVEHNPSKRSMKEIEEETDKYFLGYMEEYKKKQLEIEPSLKKIPRFFQKNSLNENYNLIYSKVRQEVTTQKFPIKNSKRPGRVSCTTRPPRFLTKKI